MTSELTLLVLRLGFLLLLWLFVFAIVYALRSDLFGQRVRKLQPADAAPAASGNGPAAPPRPSATTPSVSPPAFSPPAVSPQAPAGPVAASAAAAEPALAPSFGRDVASALTGNTMCHR